MENFDTVLEKYLEISKTLALQGKDGKTLANIAKLTNTKNYITARQAELAVKIVRENQVFFDKFIPNIETSLKNPNWSRSFRVIPQFKTIKFVKHDQTPDDLIEISFSYKKEYVDILENLKKQLGINFLREKNSKYLFSYSEINLYTIVNAFKKYKFDIDSEILENFHKIREIFQTYDNKTFDIFSGKNSNLKKVVENEIGLINEQNLLLLEDRKIRYQYQISSKFLEKMPGNTLSQKIAKRTKPRIFVSSEKYSVNDLVQSLIDLDRLPCLVILDNYLPNFAFLTLNNLVEAASAHGFENDIGIFFRYDNNEEGKKFNELIAEKKLNHRLDQNIKFVGISHTKIPKFIFKENWEPTSVLVLSQNFHQNRTSTYCDVCDLIIYYKTTKPMVGVTEEIV